MIMIFGMCPRYSSCAQQLEVEYVAFGEGEEKLPLLVEALEQNRDISNIPGI